MAKQPGKDRFPIQAERVRKRDRVRPTHYNSAVPKWVKFLLALVLLPFCGGAIGALIRLIRATGGAEAFWVAFVGGAACWLGIFLLLPKPMLVYVFGHELTLKSFK